jgi:hypothetical protein
MVFKAYNITVNTRHLGLIADYMTLGDWGLGIGDWGLGPIPNPQIPNPQSPIPNPHLSYFIFHKLAKFKNLNNFKLFEFNNLN